jgi:hypothetical protein
MFDSKMIMVILVVVGIPVALIALAVIVKSRRKSN